MRMTRRMARKHRPRRDDDDDDDNDDDAFVSVRERTRRSPVSMFCTVLHVLQSDCNLVTVSSLEH